VEGKGLAMYQIDLSDHQRKNVYARLEAELDYISTSTSGRALRTSVGIPTQ